MAGFAPQGEDTSIRDSLAMRQMGTTIAPRQIKKALKPYRLDDNKVKGKSDTQLYSMAETAVVKWWQRQQKEKIRARKPGATPGEQRAVDKVEGKVEKALDRIPSINERAEARQEERAREARQQMDEMLKGTGLRHIQPPSYALTSVHNLQAWINRQVNRRTSLRDERRDYLR